MPRCFIGVSLLRGRSRALKLPACSSTGRHQWLAQMGIQFFWGMAHLQHEKLHGIAHRLTNKAKADQQL